MTKKRKQDEPAPEGVELEDESTEDTGIRELVKFLESQGKRPAGGSDQPAWRRVEDYIENKRTKEELDDLFDFDTEDDEKQT